MDIDQVTAAVNAFLRRGNDPSRFSDIADLIALLKDDPSWTEAQVTELQGRIIGEITKRIDSGEV